MDQLPVDIEHLILVLVEKDWKSIRCLNQKFKKTIDTKYLRVVPVYYALQLIIDNFEEYLCKLHKFGTIYNRLEISSLPIHNLTEKRLQLNNEFKYTLFLPFLSFWMREVLSKIISLKITGICNGILFEFPNLQELEISQDITLNKARLKELTSLKSLRFVISIFSYC